MRPASVGARLLTVADLVLDQGLSPAADRGYDHKVYRDHVRRVQITPHIARRGTRQGSGHGSGLGVCRWVVEGAVALLDWFRRPRTRW
ncbi:hypothetical protein [Streptomyces sp. NPDC005780]|uniref:hypothetical protein n=1 Tax=Streptomyces sp. NPDC005780 TaxID=3364730 RepID=UPI00369F4F68